MTKIKRRRVCVVISPIVFLLYAGAASAHHSLAMYDRSKELKITGTLKTFEWQNPHSWIRILVEKPDGRAEEWDFEGGGVNRLSRAGWSKDMIKPGDRITVAFNPKNDGSPGGLFKDVATADGKTYSTDFGRRPFR